MTTFKNGVDGNERLFPSKTFFVELYERVILLCESDFFVMFWLVKNVFTYFVNVRFRNRKSRARLLPFKLTHDQVVSINELFATIGHDGCQNLFRYFWRSGSQQMHVLRVSINRVQFRLIVIDNASNILFNSNPAVLFNNG